MLETQNQTTNNSYKYFQRIIIKTWSMLKLWCQIHYHLKAAFLLQMLKGILKIWLQRVVFLLMILIKFQKKQKVIRVLFIKTMNKVRVRMAIFLVSVGIEVKHQKEYSELIHSLSRRWLHFCDQMKSWKPPLISKSWLLMKNFTMMLLTSFKKDNEFNLYVKIEMSPLTFVGSIVKLIIMMCLHSGK